MTQTSTASAALLDVLLPAAAGLRTVDDAGSAQLLEQATRHQVLPLLGQRAGSRLRLAPESDSRLHQDLKQNAMRALAAAALLGRIHALLSRHGINALALKGITLSQQLYGDIARRQVGDLDLLVSPSQLEAADRLLREAGLTRLFPAGTLSASQWRLYTAVRHEFVYRDAAYDFRVELHWQLNNCRSLAPGRFEELWSRRAQVAVGDTQVPVLGQDDLMLHLCIHGGTEAWPKLKWLCDIARLLERYDEASSVQLLTKARQAGLDRLLLLAAALASELLAAPLAPALRTAIAQEPTLEALTQHARRNLLELRFKPGGGAALGEAISGIVYRLRLSPRWRYRRECLLADAIVPETVLDPVFARRPLWALYCAATIKTLGSRIRRRAG